MGIRFITLFFILFLYIGRICQAQIVYYDIMKGTEKLGSIKTEKKISENTTTYTSTSKATFRVIWQYVRETNMTTIYQNGLFISADLKQFMDGDLKDHRITQKQGNSYICKQPVENTSFVFSKNIFFTTGMLYFTEPKGQTLIFAESYQCLCPLSEISPGIYKLSLPEDKVNHYVYKDGVLQEIRVFRSIVDLVFRRVK